MSESQDHDNIVSLHDQELPDLSAPSEEQGADTRQQFSDEEPAGRRGPPLWLVALLILALLGMSGGSYFLYLHLTREELPDIPVSVISGLADGQETPDAGGPDSPVEDKRSPEPGLDSILVGSGIQFELPGQTAPSTSPQDPLSSLDLVSTGIAIDPAEMTTAKVEPTTPDHVAGSNTKNTNKLKDIENNTGRINALEGLVDSMFETIQSLIKRVSTLEDENALLKELVASQISPGSEAQIKGTALVTKSNTPLPTTDWSVFGYQTDSSNVQAVSSNRVDLLSIKHIAGRKVAKLQILGKDISSSEGQTYMGWTLLSTSLASRQATVRDTDGRDKVLTL